MFHGGGELIVETNSWEGIDGIQLISFFGRKSLAYDSDVQDRINASLENVLQHLGTQERNYANVTQAIYKAYLKERE